MVKKDKANFFRRLMSNKYRHNKLRQKKAAAKTKRELCQQKVAVITLFSLKRSFYVKQVLNEKTFVRLIQENLEDS